MTADETEPKTRSSTTSGLYADIVGCSGSFTRSEIHVATDTDGDPRWDVSVDACRDTIDAAGEAYDER